MEGWVVSTFAARLPFPLRLENASSFTYELHARYREPERAAGILPGPPWVRIRIYNQPLAEAVSIRPAIAHMYGQDINLPDWLPEGAYLQWVSLETPALLLTEEAPEDGAFAFHRCLGVLDTFLRAHNLAFRDPAVYPISTRNLDPTVIVGHYPPDGGWELDQPMLVHPERLQSYDTLDASTTVEQALGGGIEQVVSDHPLLTTFAFTLRADRAGRLEGDTVDEVVSLQTAMESRLFTIWRLILVDRGKSESEIEEGLSSQNFKPLLQTQLPQALGGRWQLDARDTPVGRYWHSLYLLRNRVVHAGYEPRPPEAEEAQAAYAEMRRFVRERVRERRRPYPRTALALIGYQELAGADRQRAQAQAQELLDEPTPYYLPWDQAGRRPPPP